MFNLYSTRIIAVVILLILIGLSALFSASETALTSLSKIRIRQMKEEGIKRAEIVDKLVDNTNKMLSAILVGNNVVNIGASALATSIAINQFGEKGVTISTVVMTIVVLIFAEITPKSLASSNPEKVSLGVAKYIEFITVVLNPIAVVFTYITKGILKIFGVNADTSKPFITEEELKTMLDVSHEEGVLEITERKMIYNVFEFGDSQVKDVMIPRADIVALDINSSYDEIVETFKMQQFSRIPIYEEEIDNVIGILHVKNLVLASKENFDIRDIIHEPYFTYEYKKTTELFEEMRKQRISLTIVLDEYGGTVGLITMEDLVEEIVGDIEDEYDEHNIGIEVIKEDEYIIDGSIKIDEVNDMIGTNIESEDFDTIGGFVIGELGRFPEQGEMIEYMNVKFIIEEIDRNRIKKLKVLT
ncbi:HlyC/CorC family transporter [Clostridium botulinum]|uniref:HlyC/CorC family transporter n=1 Tax=Clostridium botulinum TaxID=1491 RepID=UPI00037B0220|nr:hemolysin family protein [Clostridium botulinum]MCD3203487.1 HlyC/CorC family transporter [Clostridium botulinum C/D]KEI02351.1 hemolysin [Clostridium botulinum D str. 16868]KLU77117.1 hemolysin [Clostridium botulinum V891]KOA73554.1 hemolysin [Clostridium botulinum]KOA93670.1 hemolysin [Clostridium botulinum]